MRTWIDCPDCTSGGIIQRQECGTCGESRMVEVALTDEQRAYYDEAIACGADHEDALEAAETGGYGTH